MYRASHSLTRNIIFRFPDITESLYKTISLMDFTEVIKKSIKFCSEREVRNTIPHKIFLGCIDPYVNYPIIVF